MWREVAIEVLHTDADVAHRHLEAEEEDSGS
jgi:hypothetical protein